VKLAMSLDGRTALADGRSKWITGEAARADVQRWRARSSAILSGSGTVLADDPALTVRLGPDDRAGSERATPLRVVIDRALRVPRQARVFDGLAPTLVFHGVDVHPQTAGDGIGHVPVESAAGGLDLGVVLRELAR